MSMHDQVSVFAAIHPGMVDPHDKVAYEEAWVKFCRCYEPKVRGWAAGMGLNAGQIDEITGRVMVKLVKTMPNYRYDPERSFSGWLRKVVKNEVLDFWSSADRVPGSVGIGGSEIRSALHEIPDAEAASDVLVAVLSEQVNDREAKVRLAVQEVKARVQAESWEAFELIAFGRFSGKEAAQRIGRTVAAVHMAKSRVAGLLREELQKLGVDC
jgi:RNA polymerase sigma factor (sigma-70 family)